MQGGSAGLCFYVRTMAMDGSLWILNSMLLGAGLAMDAFSVSLANGLHESGMKRGRMCAIAGTFAAFQTVMPLIGWFLVSMLMHVFRAVDPYIPWVAFGLLLLIGGKMILEGIRGEGETEKSAVGFGGLMLQGIATSIDALSVGFTIADLSPARAAASSLIIGAVTFAICLAGVVLGRKLGTKLAGSASVLGGIILVGIGIEILLTH